MAKQGKQRRERRRGGVPPGIRVVRDAEEVFRAAILAGVLSAERTARNWAGHYLYLFHDENGTAWFKHRDSRAHVSMTARQPAGGACASVFIVIAAAFGAGRRPQATDPAPAGGGPSACPGRAAETPPARARVGSGGCSGRCLRHALRGRYIVFFAALLVPSTTSGRTKPTEPEGGLIPR